MKIKLIGNPIAGNNGLDKIQTAARFLTEMGANVKIFLTEYAGHAEALARDCRGFDRLVVAGGDGTVNEIINGMMPTPVPLAVIPMGTANVMAIETGLPANLVNQCQIAVNGMVRNVTLGRAGDRYFLLMAGAGLDAEVVRRVSLRAKRWLGKGAYLLSALQVFSRLPPLVTLKYDGGQMNDVAGVIVCNSRKYGGNFSLAQQASLFSPVLQVVVIPHRKTLGLLYLIVRSLLGSNLATDIKVFETTNLELNGMAALQLDGDPAGVLPCMISVCPSALPMVFKNP